MNFFISINSMILGILVGIIYAHFLVCHNDHAYCFFDRLIEEKRVQGLAAQVLIIVRKVAFIHILRHILFIGLFLFLAYSKVVDMVVWCGSFFGSFWYAIWYHAKGMK